MSESKSKRTIDVSRGTHKAKQNSVLIESKDDPKRKPDPRSSLRKKENTETDAHPAVQVDDTREEQNQERDRRRSQADELVELVEKLGIELFHDQFSEAWATVSRKDVLENVRIRGKNFRQLLARISWGAWHRAPSSEALRAALNVLESKAVHDGKRHPLSVRLAWHEQALYYDLTPYAVRITSQGWELLRRPPILFKRYSGHKSQLLPERGGKIAEVLKFMNIPGQYLEGSRLLAIVHLIALCIPDVPRPIFELVGPKGSGKTTMSRVIQGIIDPNEKDVLSFPDTEREFIQTLAHHHLAVFDNLGRFPKWGSDALCRAVTGAGFSKRELYTDDDDILYSFKRGIVINSITSVASRSDLYDRCVIYGLPELEGHVEDRSFWNRFEFNLPLLLGGLFDILSAAMQLKVDDESAPRNIRMADFAGWGLAITSALGTPREEFLIALEENSKFVRREAINSSPIGICVLRLLEDHPEGWQGSPTELLAALKKVASVMDLHEKSLPREPSWLSRILHELGRDFAVYGWRLEFVHSGDRSLRFIPMRENQNGFSQSFELDDMDTMDTIPDPCESRAEITDEELLKLD
jgi:hypothetical protein